MKLAFYAPMKSPDHPVPSGDRRMGRLLWQALELAGYDLELASELRSFDRSGDPDVQHANDAAGAAEADRLIAKWRAEPARAPQGWFTYHLYHKAPDWIGPQVCKALKIPYFVAEASHAPKRTTGAWQQGYEAAAAAIGSARAVFHMTMLDRACLEPLIASNNRLVFLPPFLDIEAFQQAAVPVDIAAEIERNGGRGDRKNLLAVAMMRVGDKQVSYEQLAQSLALSQREDWQLLIIGDGEQRNTVRRVMAPLGHKVVYLGTRDAEQLPAFYDAASLYVWPAHGEAYGMAFLEAQGCGLPVVAGNIRGVPDVVKDGVTGVLTPAGDLTAFANAVDELLGDPVQCRHMADAARDFVAMERSMAKAATILSRTIGGLI